MIIWHADENPTVYWARVSFLIYVITNFHLVLTPELALLNIGINDFPCYSQNLITHILLVARLAVVSHWKIKWLPWCLPTLLMNSMLAFSKGRLQIVERKWYAQMCNYKLCLSPPIILFTFCSVINYATLVELLYPSVLHSLAVYSLCHLCLAIHFASFLTFILFEALLMWIERENLIVYDFHELGHQKDTHTG